MAFDIACDIQPLQVRRVLKLIDIDIEKREEFAREMIEAGFNSKCTFFERKDMMKITNSLVQV